MLSFLRSNNKIRHKIIAYMYGNPCSTTVLHARFYMDKDDKYARSLLYLLADKYIKLDEKQESHSLTVKGILAYNSNYFLNEHRKIVASIVTTTVLVLCNVAIAIATVMALSIASDQSKIENRINNIEQEVHRLNQQKKS